MTFLSFFHVYGLLIGIGILVGLVVIYRQSRFFKIDPKWLDDVMPWVFIGALVGARLYHLLTDWQLYTHASLIDLLAVWRGGIGFLGALLGGMIGLLWALRRRLTKLFTYLDLLAFGIPLAQAVGRLGNYVNGELYGLPTNLPWGIVIDGSRYHPLFLYELIGNLLLALGLWLLARRRALVLGKGQYFSLYLFGYCLLRFWLEFLRLETARLNGILGVFSIAQWVTLAGMVVAAVVFWVRRHAPGKAWDWTLE